MVCDVSNTTTTAQGGTVMATATNPTVTPANRFAAIEIRYREPVGSVTYRALNAASYWESFPGSYTAEMVAVATELLSLCPKGALRVEDVSDRARFDALAIRTLELLAARGW